ncbi:MAG: hypothetical protein ACK4K0_00895 [Flavobacteriales bacterium]
MKKNHKKYRKRHRLLVSMLALLVLIEVGLKLYGFGNPPLYVSHPKYEYIYAPNQEVKRFGNKIVTNAYSMRNQKGDENKQVVVLGMGDSVINGGSHTDHDSLATTILQGYLSKETGQDVAVLNVGANSWGPDNAFAYLSEKGHFASKGLFLIFNSHDWNDNRHFRPVVGVHPSWPATPPLTATGDLLVNYVLPKIKSWFGYKEFAHLDGFDDSATNSGWQNFIDYATENNLPLLVYLHADVNEQRAKKYNQKGLKIISFLEHNQIPVITDLNVMPIDGYRDNIHLNQKGQRVMAKLLQRQLAAWIED